MRNGRFPFGAANHRSPPCSRPDIKRLHTGASWSHGTLGAGVSETEHGDGALSSDLLSLDVIR